MRTDVSIRELNARSPRLTTNTGSECADAGALSRPRVNACACECPCRFSGRPWEPIQPLPEPGAAADERRIPHRRDSLYLHWPFERGALGRPGHEWPRVDAEQQGWWRRTKRRTSRCVLTGRTREEPCLR